MIAADRTPVRRIKREDDRPPAAASWRKVRKHGSMRRLRSALRAYLFSLAYLALLFAAMVLDAKI